MDHAALLQQALVLARADSRAAFHAAMCEAIEIAGARYYLAALLASDRPGTDFHFQLLDGMPAKYVHATSVPAASRVEAGLTDPVVEHCRTSSVPIAWDRRTYARLPARWQLFADHGFGQGAAVALHLTPDRHFLIGFDWASTGHLDPSQRIDAIAAIQTLAVFAEPTVTRLYNRAVNQALEIDTHLTRRELECLCYVSRGFTDAMIARLLSLAPKTVRTHVEACVRKLNASNRTEAAVIAARQGLTNSLPFRAFE